MSARYYPAPGLAGFGGLSAFTQNCNPGEWLVDVGADAPICVDQATAQQLSAGGATILQQFGSAPPKPTAPIGSFYNAGSLGTMNVKAGPSSDMNTYILVGAGALLLFFVMKRR